MAKDFDYYYDTANRMIEANQARNLAFKAYANMYHGVWGLPEELNELQWIRKYIDTSPHDSIQAGDRTLSSVRPRVRKHPYGNDQANKRKANEDEKNLEWQLMAADQRRSRGVVSEVVRSALLFDTVAINVIDLEWQIKISKENNIDTKRMQMARQYSRFAINVYNPMDVHVRYSTYGPEAVLLCQERWAYEVADEWPNVASQMEEFIEENKPVVYCWMMDLDNTCIWVGPSPKSPIGGNANEQIRIMAPTEHKMDFMPWVALVGGSQLETREERKYHPMLYALHYAGTWETSNIVQTLRNSEVIAHSGAPRYSEEGTNPQAAEIDYGSPERMAKPAPGNVLKPLAPPPIDSALSEVSDRIAGDMQRSTVSRILQGGDVPSGTAFSTLNLATQTAVGSLRPYKELAEKSLSQMFRTMMLWCKFTDEPMTAYGADPRSGYGNNYVIRPDEIEPSALYIEVELTPDVPTDRLQKANAASQMISWGYPREYALEDLGVSDPQSAMKQWNYERILDHKLQLRMQEELQMQALAMQQAQQAQAQQAQMAQQAQAQAQGAAQAPMVSGQGFNPAMGGVPPIVAQQGTGTREALTGRTFTGEGLATPEV